MFPLNQLHQGIPYEDYAAQNGLRASHLKLLKRSPAHFRAERMNPKEPTKALEDGKILHSIIENPERFMDTVTVEPVFVGLTKDGRESTRSAEAMEKKKEWYASTPENCLVVTEEQMAMCEGVYRSLTSHRLVKNILKNSIRETSLWTEDEETGEVVQIRPDIITEFGHVIDFKGTRDARPEFFLSQVFSDRYASPFYILGAAHYTHAIRSAKIGPGNSFTYVAIEKVEPYGIMLYPMDEGCIDVGERWRRQLTKTYADCRRSDRWPSYEERAFPVTPPEYAPIPIDEEFYE